MVAEGIRTATVPQQPVFTGEPARIKPVRPAPARPAPPPEPVVQKDNGREGLSVALKNANQAAASRNLDLRYGIHEASGEFYVRVFNPKTNEVIRTIPPEELLDFRAALEQSLGILFDGKA